MKDSLKTGISFGLTSGIITTLGLMVGLYSGTHSSLAVIGGVLTIAIADAFSDALGIHIAQESQNRHTAREIWESTFSTFASKFVVALTFIVPILLLSLPHAIMVGVVWGMALLAGLSLHLAAQQGSPPWKVITEHLVIAGLVIVLTHYLGDWIAATFA